MVGIGTVLVLTQSGIFSGQASGDSVMGGCGGAGLTEQEEIARVSALSSELGGEVEAPSFFVRTDLVAYRPGDTVTVTAKFTASTAAASVTLALKAACNLQDWQLLQQEQVDLAAGASWTKSIPWVLPKTATWGCEVMLEVNSNGGEATVARRRTYFVVAHRLEEVSASLAAIDSPLANTLAQRQCSTAALIEYPSGSSVATAAGRQFLQGVKVSSLGQAASTLTSQSAEARGGLVFHSEELWKHPYMNNTSAANPDDAQLTASRSIDGLGAMKPVAFQTRLYDWHSPGDSALSASKQFMRSFGRLYRRGRMVLDQRSFPGTTSSSPVSWRGLIGAMRRGNEDVKQIGGYHYTGLLPNQGGDLFLKSLTSAIFASGARAYLSGCGPRATDTMRRFAQRYGKFIFHPNLVDHETPPRPIHYSGLSPQKVPETKVLLQAYPYMSIHSVDIAHAGACPEDASCVDRARLLWKPFQYSLVTDSAYYSVVHLWLRPGASDAIATGETLRSLPVTAKVASRDFRTYDMTKVKAYVLSPDFDGSSSSLPSWRVDRPTNKVTIYKTNPDGSKKLNETGGTIIEANISEITTPEFSQWAIVVFEYPLVLNPSEFPGVTQ